MKLSTTLALSAFGTAFLAAHAAPLAKRDVDPNLIPQFGFVSGVNPTGTGDCDGAVKDASGYPIKIPCSCPPDRAAFIASLNANVKAGHAVHNPTVNVSFPTGSSTADQLARLNTAAVTLQNLNGPGVGCPAASTTFVAQGKAIQAGAPPPPPVAVASTAAPAQTTAAPAQTTAAPAKASGAANAGAAPSAAGAPTPSQIIALAPQLGFQSGKNPTGTGDCDGAVNGADGKPIKIPCACPPAQADFDQALVANVLAGHAVNNTAVTLSFPLDNSTASQLARLNTATDTLQNLRGPGVGCPEASTTFGAQAKAIQAGTSATAAPPASSAAPAKTTAAAPASSAAAANAAPAPSSGAPSAAQITALAPQLGFLAGKNPTGTGDCDGAVNGANGQPIKIPCACPPPQADFDTALVANALAGHAVNNTVVGCSYPLDGSVASQLARVDCALVTLQNLRGPGVGCPAASSTLGAQQKALLAQQ